MAQRRRLALVTQHGAAELASVSRVLVSGRHTIKKRRPPWLQRGCRLGSPSTERVARLQSPGHHPTAPTRHLEGPGGENRAGLHGGPLSPGTGLGVLHPGLPAPWALGWPLPCGLARVPPPHPPPAQSLDPRDPRGWTSPVPSPTQDPNCGASISGRGGTPIWGTGAYLEWPISLYPLSHRLPSEVQGPEPSQILGAQPWPARGQRSPHSPGSQCCPPTAETDSAGLCREQNIAVGAGGIGRVLGARVATWKGLYGPVLTTSVARAQYKGVGPQPVHLALGVLRPRGLPKLSPREEGQGTSLAWVLM